MYIIQSYQWRMSVMGKLNEQAYLFLLLFLHICVITDAAQALASHLFGSQLSVFYSY